MTSRIITAEDKLKCVERELRLRRQVYHPNRLLTKRMSAERAAWEIDVMAAIVADYRELAAKERLL